jgi:hypothetical protein
MTSVEYLMSKKITPVIKVVGESNQSEVFVTMTIRQFEEYAEYCADKAYGDGYTDALRDRPRRNIDTAVAEVEKFLPTDEEIREMSNEYARKHTEPKAGYVLNRRFGFQNGATWMRDLIQEKSKK